MIYKYKVTQGESLVILEGAMDVPLKGEEAEVFVTDAVRRKLSGKVQNHLLKIEVNSKVVLDMRKIFKFPVARKLQGMPERPW